MVLKQGENSAFTAKIRNKESGEVIPTATLRTAVINALLMDSARHTVCIWRSSNDDFIINEDDSFSWVANEQQTSKWPAGYYKLEIGINAGDTGTMIGDKDKIIQVVETNLSKLINCERCK